MKKKKLLKATVSTAVILIAGVIIACSNSLKAKERPKFLFKDQAPRPGVSLKIDDKEFSEDELMGDQRMEFAEAARRIYDLKINRVGSLLLEKAYGDEAKKANLGLDDYIDTKVLKDPKITDSEVNKFAEGEKIPKEQVAQYKDQIIMYLKSMKKAEERQELVASLTKKHKVELYFSKPAVKVDVELGNGPVAGDRNSKVHIVEFSDFQCPYCGKGAALVSQLKKQYGKKIAIAFRHFPLQMHPQAKPAAEASMCIYEQNPDKFWAFHDKVFADQAHMSNDDLKNIAKGLGVKMDAFNTCFDSHKHADAVQKDMDYGVKLGVRSTPTFIVNGRIIQGAQRVQVFSDIIDEELSQ